MTDYRCPSCDGGFPATHDDECPWCGEAMDGAKSTSDVFTPPGLEYQLLDPVQTARERFGSPIPDRLQRDIDDSETPLSRPRWHGDRDEGVTDCG